MKTLVVTDFGDFLEKSKLRKWINADSFIIKNDNYPDLTEYDFAFFYFINTSKVRIIPQLKDKYSKCKIAVTTDSDFWWWTCPWYKHPDLHNNRKKQETIKSLKKADLVLCINRMSYKWFKENNIKTALPEEYAGFFSAQKSVPSQINFKKRFQNKKVVILAHSIPNYKIDTNLQVIRKFGLRVILIGTFHNKNILRNMLNGYENAEVYERLDSKPYMEKLNECFLGLEDWYAGGSRFGIECGWLGVPVIGSKNALSVVMINPELTCENADVNCYQKKVESLLKLTEQQYVELSKSTMEKTRKIFSEEEAKKRFLNLLKKHLNITFPKP